MLNITLEELKEWKKLQELQELQELQQLQESYNINIETISKKHHINSIGLISDIYIIKQGIILNKLFKLNDLESACVIAYCNSDLQIRQNLKNKYTELINGTISDQLLYNNLTTEFIALIDYSKKQLITRCKLIQKISEITNITKESKSLINDINNVFDGFNASFKELEEFVSARDIHLDNSDLQELKNLVKYIINVISAYVKYRNKNENHTNPFITSITEDEKNKFFYPFVKLYTDIHKILKNE